MDSQMRIVCLRKILELEQPIGPAFGILVNTSPLSRKLFQFLVNIAVFTVGIFSLHCFIIEMDYQAFT